MIKFHQQRKDLLATLINQLWRLVSGPIILILIPVFLSPEQQGYWYLFGSISALSIFADLGFSNIILQFSAHEYAFLHFAEDGLLAGAEDNLKKLGSFFRFVVKWISTICAFVFPVIYIIGIGFFVRDKVLGIYLIPWTIFAIGSLISFFSGSVLSFVEGLNRIELIQKIRFIVSILNTVIITIILVLGGNIYALAFGMLLSSLSIFASIFGSIRKVLKQLLKISKGFIYNWRKETLPLFAKYAISASSGYFSNLLFTPLAHYFYGPVYSGKTGITLSLVMAIFNISYIWIYTIIPKLNIIISKKLWKDLDALFMRRLLLSIGTYLLIAISLFIFLTVFGNFWIIPKITTRFLPPISIIMVTTYYFLAVFVNAWSTYLRGHKKEPYVIIFVISAVWITIITYFAGRYLSPIWIFIGLLSSSIWGIPLYYMIYKKCRKVWHGK